VFEIAIAALPDAFEARCAALRPMAAVEQLADTPEWGEAEVVIIGEVHGRISAPCLLEALAQRAISEGRAVAFGFEDEGDPAETLAGIKQAIANEDIAGALARVVATPSWSTPWHDGRESVAIYALFHFAFTAISGAPQRLEFLNHGRGQRGQQAKRDTMTRRLADLLARQSPDTVTFALMGNNWTGGYADSVCVHLEATAGVDPLCIEVSGVPGDGAAACSWRMGPPSVMDLNVVAGWDDPVDYVLRTPCERRVGPAVEALAAR
jgi:hypothetical protein